MRMINKVNSMGQCCWGSWSNTLGFSALGCLTLLIICLCTPTVTSTAKAEEVTLQAIDAVASIAVALDSEVAMDILPSSGGSFGRASLSLQVKSNSNAGYKLYLGAGEATASLISTVQPEAGQAIEPTKGSRQASEFEPNTWGYALTATAADDQTVYHQLPATQQEVLSVNTANADDHYNLTIGAKLDTSLPAGQYASIIILSAIANPNQLSGLYSIGYMQDMTSAICRETKGTDQSPAQDASGSYIVTPGNEPTKQLIDIRDGKEYWVSKLADGNCWMTQNLAYDLVKGKVLTFADSDVSSNWTVPTSTEKAVPARGADYSLKDTDTFSWNLGEYVLATPSKAKVCNSAPTSDSTQNDGYNSLRPGQTFAQNCPDFQNVATWQPVFQADTGAWHGETTETYTEGGVEKQRPLFVAANEADRTYDAHYLIGNYYQLNTATAGTGGSLRSVNAETNAALLKNASSSICPKGWKLPVAGRNTTNGQPFDLDKSFYKLLAAYGYPKTGNYAASAPYWIGATPILYGKIGNANQDLAYSPLSYVRAGYVSKQLASVRDAGYGGDVWSSTAYPVEYPNAGVVPNFDLRFTSIDVQPNFNINRYIGLAVRCVAR